MSVSATQLSARLRSWALVAGISGLIVGLGALIGGTFLWLFAALAVIVSLLGHLFSDPVVLHVTRARELRERDAAEVHRSVRELALRAGIPTPRLYVMPGDRAKAFATGCNPQHAAIAITEGLLLDLPLEQTRGVLAHELAHIANRDILVSSIAATISGMISALAAVLQLSFLFGASGDQRLLCLLGLLAAIVLAPVGATVVQLAVSRRREYRADATAARLLGCASPLADALTAIDQHERAKGKTNPATAPQAILSPLARWQRSPVFSTHPLVYDRIRRLRADDTRRPLISTSPTAHRRSATPMFASLIHHGAPGSSRALAVLTTAVSAGLMTAADAFARSGSGSSGFGRGRSGSGGGLGNGHFFFVPVGGSGGVLLLILIVVIMLYLLPRVTMWWHRQQSTGRASRRRVAERERRVELAAAEAAEDDPAFAPEQVRAQAAGLFVEIQSAWDARDRARLRGLVGQELMAEWERRLDDFDRKGWHNRVQPIGEPSIEYVGLTNRGEDRADRVVVRIEATLQDYVEDAAGQRVGRVDGAGERTRMREFWTLAKRDRRWILQSIEQGAEGAHRLSEGIVATPWGDDRALRDEALVERAVQDAVPPGVKLAELADLNFEGDGRAAALDLSLADGRFAPDILEVAARRAVAAWADAVDGDDGPLLAVSHPDAARELLHPGDPSLRTRLVVRGLAARRITIVSLDPVTEPPTMTIDVELSGRRYLEDRGTAAVIAGSQSRAVTFTEHWTLSLDGPDEQPWRISLVGSTAGRA